MTFVVKKQVLVLVSPTSSDGRMHRAHKAVMSAENFADRISPSFRGVGQTEHRVTIRRREVEVWFFWRNGEGVFSLQIAWADRYNSAIG